MAEGAEQARAARPARLRGGSRVEGDRNIQLTVVQPPEDEDEINIDLSAIGDGMKRFLVLWLALAVAFGAIAGGVTLRWQAVRYAGDAMALIARSGVAEITKIQSPTVVEDALNMLGLELEMLDSVRTSIRIESVMSDKAYDQRTLYYNLLTKSANLDAVRSLLDTEDDVTRYIVALNYKDVGCTREEGIELLSELLNAYRRYIENTYNYNMPMGSSVNVIDYREYDYAEAANIFAEALDDIQWYLAAVERSDASDFRSNETGYTFGDLANIAEMLKDIELDRVTSYITINSVTANDPSREISHYEWLIENLERRRTVQEARLQSLAESIETYEKDPIILVAGEENTLEKDPDEQDNYDSMIEEKLNTQREISGYTRTIRYYESVIEGFRTTGTVSQRDVEKVEGYLASLNEKLNQLIRDVNATADEYYEKATFANTLRVLVPAMAEENTLSVSGLALNVGIVEGALLVAYLGAAVIYGLKKANPRKEQTASTGA